MVYHIVSKFKKALLLCLALVLISSCSDIIDTEPNVKKTLINMTPTYTLNQLIVSNIDFGDVRYGSVNIDSLSIVNLSTDNSVEIYSMSSTNPNQLFTYTFTQGLPFLVLPLENTKLTGKITAKFYAQSFYFKEYTDTLILNNNENYKIIIRANLKSF